MNATRPPGRGEVNLMRAVEVPILVERPLTSADTSVDSRRSGRRFRVVSAPPIRWKLPYRSSPLATHANDRCALPSIFKSSAVKGR